MDVHFLHASWMLNTELETEGRVRNNITPPPRKPAAARLYVRRGELWRPVEAGSGSDRLGRGIVWRPGEVRKSGKEVGCLTWVLRDEQGFTRQTEKVREEKHCSPEDCLQGCLLARDA